MAFGEAPPRGNERSVRAVPGSHATNPPHFIKDTNPTTTDHEPGGVFHSMIAIGKYLYVVETNRGFLLRVDPRTGAIETLYDMTIDDREHNPIVMTQRGRNFRFDRRTGKRTKVLTGFATFPNGLVEGRDGALYTSNQGISFAPGDGEILRIVP